MSATPKQETRSGSSRRAGGQKDYRVMEAEAINSRVDELSRDVRALEKDVRGIKDEVKGLRGDIRRLDIKVTQMGGDLNGTVTEMSGDLNGKVTRMGGDLNGKITEMGGDLNGKIAGLNGKFNGLDVKIDGLKNEIAWLKWIIGMAVVVLAALLSPVIRDAWTANTPYAAENRLESEVSSGD